MKFIINEHDNLIISIDDEEQQELMNVDEIHSNRSLYDFFERLICNSEFEWIDAEEIGALTEAPIIGTRFEDGTVDRVWWFPSYASQSVLEVLCENKVIVFQSGNIS